MLGIVADGYISPIIYTSSIKEYKIPKTYLQSFGIYSLKMINENAQHKGLYQSVKDDALSDLYVYFRDIYEQKREYEIRH